MYIVEAGTEGFLTTAGMLYEQNVDTASIDADRHWWVQAETIVGYINLYQHFDDKLSLSRALQCWEFVKRNLIDRENGEWYWSLRADGSVNRNEDKADPLPREFISQSSFTPNSERPCGITATDRSEAMG